MRSITHSSVARIIESTISLLQVYENALVDLPCADRNIQGFDLALQALQDVNFLLLASSKNEFEISQDDFSKIRLEHVRDTISEMESESSGPSIQMF